MKVSFYAISKIVTLCIVSVVLSLSSCKSEPDYEEMTLLHFAQSGDTTFIVHPFMADEGAELVLPAFWSADSIIVRCDEGECHIDGKAIGHEWTSLPMGPSAKISISLLSGDVEVSVRRSALDAICINTSLGDVECVTKTRTDSGRILVRKADGEMQYVGRLSSIKGRGNTTWLNARKKPFVIKMGQKVSLFGWAEGKKFNLLADAFDKTKLHNWLALNIARDFGIRFPIACRHVALWINGDYRGIYLLTEPVDVGKRGIDIADIEKETELVNGHKFSANDVTKFDADGNVLSDTVPMSKAHHGAVASADNPKDISGGYVIEFLPWTREPDNKFGTPYASLCLRNPKFPTLEQLDYVKCRWTKVLSMANDGDSAIFNYLNVDSYARYYLLQEMLHGCDVCTASVFHVKDKDSVDSLFYAAPAWDFDIAMRPMCDGMKDEARILQLRPSVMNKVLLFPNLYRIASFRDTAQSLYFNAFSPVLHHYFGSDCIDSMANVLAKDVALDKRRWSESYDYPAEIEELKSFMSQRVSFFDDDLQTPENEYFTINVDFDFFDMKCCQWHVVKGDSFELYRPTSYWKTLDYVEDDFGRRYDFSFVPTENLNLHYRWHDATKFEKLKWKVAEWLNK